MQRFVPFKVKLSAFTGSMNGRIALPLLLGTIVAVFVVLNIVDLKSLKFVGASGLKIAPGRVHEVSATAVSVNKRRVIRYRYTYKVAGFGTLSGVSYMNRVHRFGTNTVPVEYLDDDPSVSRIRGMRSGIISPIFALFLIPLLGITGFFMFRGMGRARRILAVLDTGELTKGRFVEEQTTARRVNSRRVMACTFEYEVHGTVYRMTARTHRPELVKDEPEERIVYDSDDPSRAVLFDLLPGPIKDFFLNE